MVKVYLLKMKLKNIMGKMIKEEKEVDIEVVIEAVMVEEEEEITEEALLKVVIEEDKVVDTEEREMKTMDNMMKMKMNIQSKKYNRKQRDQIRRRISRWMIVISLHYDLRGISELVFHLRVSKPYGLFN